MTSVGDPPKSEFNDIDFWRLNESLSVTNASMLTVGIDPGIVESVSARNPIEGRFHFRNEGSGSENYFTSGKFIAVFSALRGAILANRLRANIASLARPTSGENWESERQNDEGYLSYDALLVGDGTTLKTNAEVKDNPWGRFGAVYFVKEPDWSETNVDVVDLVEWMGRRSFRPPFFFPEIPIEGFRNRNHPRYSPKLACAVGAWEAIERSKPNLSVKATISEWVTANAVTFGMVEADGIPSVNGVEEVAKVANWETRGGANRTSGEAIVAHEPSPPETIDNFTEMKKSRSASSQEALAFLPGGMDDDIPF